MTDDLVARLRWAERRHDRGCASIDDHHVTDGITFKPCDCRMPLLREAADALDSLVWFRDEARQVFEFGCSCGQVFDSLEAYAAHRRTHQRDEGRL